jgi:hypothetical protein
MDINWVWISCGAWFARILVTAGDSRFLASLGITILVKHQIFSVSQ